MARKNDKGKGKSGKDEQNPRARRVTASTLALVWRNYFANRFPMSGQETPSHEELMMNVLVGDRQRTLPFPWREHIEHLGRPRKAQMSADVSIDVIMPSFDDMLRAVSSLQDETRETGAEVLDYVNSDSVGEEENQQEGPEQERRNRRDARARAFQCAAGIKTLEPIPRFVLMRLVRHTLAELGLYDLLATKLIDELRPASRMGNRKGKQARETLQSLEILRGHVRRVLENPFWGFLFAFVYTLLELRPPLPVEAFLPLARYVRAIRQPELEDAEAANQADPAEEGAAEVAAPAAAEVAEVAGEEQPPAPDIPVLQGLRPLAGDDPRRATDRFQEYARCFRTVEFFEAVGENLEGCIAMAVEEPAPTDPLDDHQWIICDAPADINRKRAAYVFLPSLADAPGDRTSWVEAAMLTRQAARQNPHFVRKFNHIAPKPGDDEGAEPRHIVNMKRFFKVAKRRLQPQNP